MSKVSDQEKNTHALRVWGSSLACYWDWCLWSITPINGQLSRSMADQSCQGVVSPNPSEKKNTCREEAVGCEMKETTSYLKIRSITEWCCGGGCRLNSQGFQSLRKYRQPAFWKLIQGKILRSEALVALFTSQPAECATHQGLVSVGCENVVTAWSIRRAAKVQLRPTHEEVSTLTEDKKKRFQK